MDVYSPQYDTIFSYDLFYNNNESSDINAESPLIKLINQSKNANTFIERTLILTLGYILITKIKDESKSSFKFPPVLGIKLRADNDFYSQVSTLKSLNLFPPTPNDVESIPPFQPAGEHKTGMGSSAALVTSLVASLLHYFDMMTDQKTVVHNLAQTAHSLAQGKIGSGFDVSAAVYGSQIYSRFSQSIIQPLLKEFTGDIVEISVSFANSLTACIHDDWDTIQKPFDLPYGIEIIMADVCGGSESPSMARKVLQWHKEYKTKDSTNNDDDDDDNNDDDYWEGLKKINLELNALFQQLKATMDTMNIQELNELLSSLSKMNADQWHNDNSELGKQLIMIREAFLESRSLLKAMGEAANVPIEPDEQTNVADATMEIPGVIAAGVPGAGGNDALFCLYIKGEETSKSDIVRDSIAKLWGEWKGCEGQDEDKVVSPMGVRAVGWGEGLEIKSEMTW